MALDILPKIVASAQTMRFDFGDGRPAEIVQFRLADSDAEFLRSFLQEANVLEEVLLSLGPNAVRFRVSAEKGHAVVFSKKEPTLLERAALLHHLRPFVLENEPFSFYKTKGIVDRSSESLFLRTRLKEIKSLFSGAHLRGQLVIKNRDIVLNSEAMLRNWLNGFEYHREPSKAKALEERLGGLPLDSSRPILLMLMISKGQAVLHLGHIVAKMLGLTISNERP
jgi:hypothetical protein